MPLTDFEKTLSEDVQISIEACEESIAAGKMYAMCQSCGWPIEYGDICYFSMAAEGHICQHCQKLYTN